MFQKDIVGGEVHDISPLIHVNMYVSAQFSITIRTIAYKKPQIAPLEFG